MHKHINVFSYVGSLTAMFGYINWIQTLSIASLVVSMAAGAVTLLYTIHKWRKETRNEKARETDK